MFVAFLNCWLLLHLDMTERMGENPTGFPPHLQDPDRTELEEILEIINREVARGGGEFPSALWRSVMNNTIYAVARLAPTLSAEELPSNNWLGILTEQYIVDRVSELETYEHRSVEELDTLGYYYFKVGYWSNPASEKGIGFLRRARELLQLGREKVTVDNVRTRNTLDAHLNRIEEILGQR